MELGLLEKVGQELEVAVGQAKLEAVLYSVGALVYSESHSRKTSHHHHYFHLKVVQP